MPIKYDELVVNPTVVDRELGLDETDGTYEAKSLSSPYDSGITKSSVEFSSSQPQHFPPISSDLQGSLAKDFHAGKQFLTIIGKGFLLWIRSALLLTLIGVVLAVFHRKPVMSSVEKDVFNTIITGASIALGLNIATGLNEMTQNVRWYILSRKPRSMSEVDVIIQSDVSKLDTYLLGPRPWAGGTAFLWLLVNIGCQIGVACLGLSYSIDSQTRVVLINDGHVNTTNFNIFYPFKSTTAISLTDSRWAANNFGNMALLSSAYDTVENSPQPGDAYNSVDSRMWHQLSKPPYFWQYRFLSSSSSKPFQPGSPPVASIYTNRTITASWRCSSYKVKLPSGNGLFTEITYIDNATSGHTSNYTVPVVRVGQATFWSGTADEGTPRSVQVYGFEPDPVDPWFYNCNITVSQVANATHPNHTISDTMAITAGSAIALGGIEYAVDNTTLRHAAQRYPQRSWGYGARWEGNAQSMGSNIAHFAIGAISVADKFNPRITLPGDEPKEGFVLTIPNAAYLIAIFSVVAGIQLILLLVTTLLANRVVVTDDSPVAIARLLSPAVSRLGNAGTIASGKEICKALEREDRMRVVYTVHRDDSHEVRKRLILSDGERESAMGDGVYN